MINSTPASSFVSSSPIHSGTSIEGVTDLMKDTQFRHLAREVVNVYEHDRGARTEAVPSQIPSIERVRLKLLEAKPEGAGLDNSALKLVNESDTRTPDLSRIVRQHALLPDRELRKKNPEPAVVVHRQVHEASQMPRVQRPSLLARAVFGCLNSIKRCFTGNPG